MTFEEWSTLVRGHDLTYGYSDDPSVYRRDRAVHDLIIRESHQFPLADVKRVWNQHVDSILIPAARGPFYWQEVVEG